MRKLKLCSIILVVALTLGGCNSSTELEKQAYVLVLGVDRLGDGRLELTARVPKIGGAGGNSNEKGSDGGDKYLTFSGIGADYAQALEALQLATPRLMNLSHIEMLVLSRALAEENGFRELINRIILTPHLYATARFVVCDGIARDFVEAQQPVIGARLSEDIGATLDHYAAQGYIPDASFADVCFASNSIYSDPVAIRGYVAKNHQDTQAISLAGSAWSNDTDSPMRQRFEGAVLFKDGMAVGMLDARQTRLLNVIKGESRSLSIDCDGDTYGLISLGRASREAHMDLNGVRLSLRMRMTASEDLCAADMKRIEELLSGEIRILVGECQSLGVDPLGFAEAAAGSFASVPEWLAYDWRERYQAAAVEIQIMLQLS